MTSGSRVGWLGAGRMGSAMAGRLRDASVDVMIWNRTASKLDSLVERGAKAVTTIAELTACDVVFVMVATSDDLLEVVAGPVGLLAGDVHPAIVVDCSTVSAEASASTRAACAERDVAFLAAPVSGNPHVVAAGRCCFVVSGPREAFDRVEPLLQLIGTTAVYAGEGEESRLVKLCHNLYLGVLAHALVEVTSLAEKGGTSPQAFLDFLNATVLGSDWVRRRSPDLVQRDWKPTFTTELLRKDFDLGLGAARRLEVPMPLSSQTYQAIQVAIGLGLRDQDFLSLYDVQSWAAGLRPIDIGNAIADNGAAEGADG